MRRAFLSTCLLLASAAPVADAQAAKKSTVSVQTSLIDSVAVISPDGEESEELADQRAWGRGLGSHSFVGFRVHKSVYVGPFLHLDRGTYAAPLSRTDEEGATTHELVEHRATGGALGIGFEAPIAKHFWWMMGLGYGRGSITTTFTQQAREVEAPVQVFCFHLRMARSFSVGPHSALRVGLDIRSLGYKWSPSDGKDLFPGHSENQLSSGGFGPSLGYVHRF